MIQSRFTTILPIGMSTAATFSAPQRMRPVEFS